MEDFEGSQNMHNPHQPKVELLDEHCYDNLQAGWLIPIHKSLLLLSAVLDSTHCTFVFALNQ